MVFLVEPDWVPAVAEALAGAGAGAIVATGPLPDTARVLRLPLSSGWQAALRVSETLGPPVHAAVEVLAGQDPLAAALALAGDATRPLVSARQGSDRPRRPRRSGVPTPATTR